MVEAVTTGFAVAKDALEFLKTANLRPKTIVACLAFTASIGLGAWAVSSQAQKFLTTNKSDQDLIALMHSKAGFQLRDSLLKYPELFETLNQDLQSERTGTSYPLWPGLATQSHKVAMSKAFANGWPIGRSIALRTISGGRALSRWTDRRRKKQPCECCKTCMQ